MRHVIFRLGSELYGLPLSSVREVIEPGPLSRVPRAPPAVRGIMNVRGRVVTVVDLARLLAVGVVPEANTAAKIVLLDRGRRDLGLLVDAVPGIHAVEQEISPAPGSANPALRGIARSASGAVTLLDADGVEQQIASALRPRGVPLG